MQWARYNLFLLLCLVLTVKATLFPSSKYPFGFHNTQLLNGLLPILQNKLQNWDTASLKVLLSYLLGFPLRGMKDLNDAHAQLYLSHLLSPSAFHLLSLTWLLEKVLPPKALQVCWLSLFILTQVSISFHPALVRSIGLCFAMTFIKQISNDQKKATLLILVLALDYFWGSYQLMPLSYIFSLIILGNLLLLPKHWSLKIKLLIAQLNLVVIFSLKLQLLTFILGFYLGAIFLPLFTILIVYLFLIPGYWFRLSSLLETLFNLYLLTMQELSTVTLNYCVFSSTDNLIFLIFGLCLKYKRNSNIPLMVMALILPQL